MLGSVVICLSVSLMLVISIVGILGSSAKVPVKSVLISILGGALLFTGFTWEEAVNPPVTVTAYASGCESGELLVPRINIWPTPHQRNGVIGKLHGGCPVGERVEVTDKFTRDDDSIMWKIETQDGVAGWVPDSLLRF